jgi:hypothetical protein
MRDSYYAMKKRLGGMKLTPREKLIYHYYPCPGNILHDIQPCRQGILFNHFYNRPLESYVVYWRSHPAEYTAMCNLIDSKRRLPKV